jgi:hypothetical protein
MLLAVSPHDDTGGRPLAELERFADESLPPMRSERMPVALAYRAEVAISLGRAAPAKAIYDDFLPWSGQIVIGGMGEGCQGAADRYLGMLAAAGGRWEEADGHYRRALALELGLRAPPLVARTRYWYGSMLLERGLTEAGRTEVGAALTIADTLGMTTLASHAAAALA